jgi:hypothetical protein
MSGERASKYDIGMSRTAADLATTKVTVLCRHLQND